MSSRRQHTGREGHEDELRRYGLERNPREEEPRELELADRLAEQASLPPGEAGARALARLLLGRGAGGGRPGRAAAGSTARRA